MAKKKPAGRTRTGRTTRPGSVRRPARPTQSGNSGVSRTVQRDLEALTERLDMMLPELIARVAALEHLLVEKGVCDHRDFRRSRQFIDDQEGW